MNLKLGIVNTNCANLASLKFSLENLGFKPFVSDSKKELEKADKLFLPGVGTAFSAMKTLKEKNLLNFLKNTDKPLLGICLGMQLLGTFSQEFNQETLNIMDFVTTKFDNTSSLIHMGWNEISSSHKLFKGLSGMHFYFVHGYFVLLNQYTIATTVYTQTFSAAINKNNFFGVQFHPEKSSSQGQEFLLNFIRL